MEEITHPWDRQPGEPIMWFDRFDRLYRVLGPERNLTTAYNLWRKEKGQKRGSADGTWRKIAEKWDWQERAEAFDEYERRERLQAEKEERAKMLKEHIAMARSMWGQGLRSLKQMVIDDVKLNATEARIYIKDGITLERQARGLPEYLLQIAAMSDEELLGRYAEILARYAGAGSVDGGDAEAGAEPADADQN